MSFRDFPLRCSIPISVQPGSLWRFVKRIEQHTGAAAYLGLRVRNFALHKSSRGTKRNGEKQ